MQHLRWQRGRPDPRWQGFVLHRVLFRLHQAWPKRGKVLVAFQHLVLPRVARPCLLDQVVFLPLPIPACHHHQVRPKKVASSAHQALCRSDPTAGLAASNPISIPHRSPGKKPAQPPPTRTQKRIVCSGNRWILHRASRLNSPLVPSQEQRVAQKVVRVSTTAQHSTT